MADSFVTSEWNKYLNAFDDNQKDIYFSEEYVKLYENDLDKAESFVYTKGNIFFLFPYLKRKIKIIERDFFDFESQYGYGGPITNTSDCKFIDEAQEAFYQQCIKNNIVCGFVRFHPLLSNNKLLDKKGQVLFDRKTVVVDLTLSEKEIWETEIHSKNRNVIRKAISEGLYFKVDHRFDNIQTFVKLYNQTMQKVNADDYYFFGNEYFNNLIRNLKDKVFLGLVYSGEKIISAAIFFKQSAYGHYHLSGSDKDFLNVAPNNFLLYSAAMYLKQQGCSLFHLGGGSTASEDNLLFKFKQRFSNKNYQFYIGKLIFNSEVYMDTCQLWENKNKEKKEMYKNILLKYRY